MAETVKIECENPFVEVPHELIIEKTESGVRVTLDGTSKMLPDPVPSDVSLAVVLGYEIMFPEHEHCYPNARRAIDEAYGKVVNEA